MARIMIGLPVEVLERVRDIAAQERRPVKHQIEHIVIKAIQERDQAGQAASKEKTHAS